MKAILISINPKHLMNILNGKKTIELRKAYPHNCDLPIDVYIYCTSHKNYHESLYEVCEQDGGGYDVDYYNPCNKAEENDYLLNNQVVAKFTLNTIDHVFVEKWGEERYYTSFMTEKELFNKACLGLNDIRNYLHAKDGWAWHIDNLVIFDKPKKISEFGTLTNKCNGFRGGKKPLTRAPQSWCYVEI